MSSLEPRPAGWYPDPAGGMGRRWHDGQGWTAKISHSRPRAPLGAAFAGLADWLSRLLVTCCALNLLAIPLMLWTRSGSGIAPMVSTQPGMQPGLQPATPGPPVDIPDQFYVAVVFLLVLGLVQCVTGVVWLVWQAQIAGSAQETLKSSPAMHVVWWFVPVASYWMPVRNISDLWRTFGQSHQRAGAGADPVLAPPIFLWWACWILAACFNVFACLAVLGGSFLAQTQTLTVLGIVGAVLMALAAGLAALVVRQLSWVALLTHAAIA